MADAQGHEAHRRDRADLSPPARTGQGKVGHHSRTPTVARRRRAWNWQRCGLLAAASCRFPRPWADGASRLAIPRMSSGSVQLRREHASRELDAAFGQSWRNRPMPSGRATEALVSLATRGQHLGADQVLAGARQDATAISLDPRSQRRRPTSWLFHSIVRRDRPVHHGRDRPTRARPLCEQARPEVPSKMVKI